MKFMQVQTGAVLDTDNEDAIAMMASSKHYIAVEQPKAEKQKRTAKSSKANQ